VVRSVSGQALRIAPDPQPISFHVPGVPVAKGRPRITTRGGKVRSFTPAKTVAFEGLVSLAAERAMEGTDPLAGPVHLVLYVQLPIPQSWSGKKKLAALSGALQPCSRPDLDNYIKAAADGGNGILWRDDSQIVLLTATKRYAEVPGLDVEVMPLRPLASCRKSAGSPCRDLNVDHAYQRMAEEPSSKRLIRHIAENWDWRLCAPLTVSDRAPPEPGLYVIDGQHRLAAAMAARRHRRAAVHHLEVRRHRGRGSAVRRAQFGSPASWRSREIPRSRSLEGSLRARRQAGDYRQRHDCRSLHRRAVLEAAGMRFPDRR
jgi:Holliday junction resolvase RusA-like endonuclease